MQTQFKKTKGFKQSGQLLRAQIRKVSEERGFSETKVLTLWPEIAGEQIAAIARPVDVKYGRQGLGATLTLLTTGANAPQLEMQKEELRRKVNAVYGYNAIEKIRITQTAPQGFAEGQADFTYRKKSKPKIVTPAAKQDAGRMAGDVADQDLRTALSQLGANVLTRNS